MYPDWVWLLSGAVFLWFLALTFLVWQQGKFLRSLFPKSGEADLRKKLEELLKDIEGFGADLGQVKNKLAEVEKQGRVHIQRIELLRYNPYDDTGGDQSFTVCLLDDQGTGIVVTSLHARSGTRAFAKDVRLGKGSKYQLSKEEELVIKKAMEK